MSANDDVLGRLLAGLPPATPAASCSSSAESQLPDALAALGQAVATLSEVDSVLNEFHEGLRTRHPRPAAAATPPSVVQVVPGGGAPTPPSSSTRAAPVEELRPPSQGDAGVSV